MWFFLNNFLLAGAIGAVSTVWFTIGGTMDLRRLFRDLAQKEANVLDDGRVIGHVSADDLSLVQQVEGAAPVEEASHPERVDRAAPADPAPEKGQAGA